MIAKLLPDLEMAHRHLALLDDDEVHTFQTIPEKGGYGARVLHGALNKLAPTLINLNRAGHGVFVMVNKGDGKIHPPNKTCRASSSVVRIRGRFLDLDGSPLGPVIKTAPAPNIIVESSKDKWHAYWLTEGEVVDDANRTAMRKKFKEEQQAIAAKFKGDLQVCDLPRVLRVAGFFHQKREPFMSRLVFPK